MYLSKRQTSTDDDGDLAAGPWPLLRRLEAILRQELTPDALIGAVLGLFGEIDHVAAGWAGRRTPDARFSVWSSTLKFREVFTGANMADWLPDDAGGGLAAVWAAGASRVSDRTAAILLTGQAGFWGVLVIAGARRGVIPKLFTPEICDHFGALIGNALESRERQAAMTRTRIFYETLVAGADMLMKARSETGVLRRICTGMVKSGLFISVRIGELDDEGHYRRVVLHAAAGNRAMRRLLRKYAPYPPQDTVTVQAWRTATTVIANDYLNDMRYRPWHAMARAAGWRSIAAVPVFRGAKRWAVLTVDAATPEFFDDALQSLLERLAAMVGHALDELDLKFALVAERQAQNRIARLDRLTNLPNRLALADHIRASLAPGRRHGPVAIGVLNLDDFKAIINNIGREAGDLVLRTVGQRLAAALRDGDFVGRLDGDAFGLVLADWRWADAPGFCKRLHAAIGAPIALPDGQTINARFSIGFTLAAAGDDTPDALLRQADIALRAAKAAVDGEAFWRLYQELDPDTRGPGYVSRLLRAGALVVHYQPVIEIQSGEVVAAEALSRLNDGNNLLPPAVFLKDMALPERKELFHQVLSASLKQLQAWDAQGKPLSLSVNVDSQILLLADTPAFLDQALRVAGVAPQRLVLEILETHEFLDLSRAGAQLSALRGRGIRIALDDLGAGYSSILKLRDLPIDVVKLDRAFTSGLRQRPDDLAFIAAFQTLTRSLGKMLVVEGVETPDILDALRMMGTGMAQGYGIARPMAGEALSGWLRGYQPERPETEPTTLLGAYAVHLIWTQNFQLDRWRRVWAAPLGDHDPFALDRFFAKQLQAGSRIARSYRDFQALLRRGTADHAAVVAAATRFGANLVAALAVEA